MKILYEYSDHKKEWLQPLQIQTASLSPNQCCQITITDHRGEPKIRYSGCYLEANSGNNPL